MRPPTGQRRSALTVRSSPYSPNDNFIGDDTFVYGITDGFGGVATATVSVTVFDAVPDWDFVGLLNPWKPNYSVKAGSAIPLKWYYTDPGSGVKVDSSGC